MKLRPSLLARTLSKLRSWLRYTWLSRPLDGVRDRLKQLGWLPAAVPAPRRKRDFHPLLEDLEGRFHPNDPLGTPLAALAGLGLQEVAATTLLTPARLLINGADPNAIPTPPAPTVVPAQLPPDLGSAPLPMPGPVLFDPTASSTTADSGMAAHSLQLPLDASGQTSPDSSNAFQDGWLRNIADILPHSQTSASKPVRPARPQNKSGGGGGGSQHMPQATAHGTQPAAPLQMNNPFLPQSTDASNAANYLSDPSAAAYAANSGGMAGTVTTADAAQSLLLSQPAGGVGPLTGSSGLNVTVNTPTPVGEGSASPVHQVATFTDPSGPTSPAAYQATILWGDGTSTANATITSQSGGFAVSGSHTYTEEGTYTEKVIVTQYSSASGSPTVSASGTATVTVTDSPLTIQLSSVTLAEGQSGPGVLATVTDQGGAEATSDYLATILWGDGTSSTGTVLAGTSNTVKVSANHTYTAAGSYNLQVEVIDDGNTPTPGSTVWGSQTITVTDPVLTVTPSALSSTVEGQSFTAVVGSFSDPGVVENASNYQATILWGDGASSTGTINFVSGNQFQVTGSHSYSEEGTYTVTLAVREDGYSPNPGAWASRTTTIVAADASLSVTLPAGITVPNIYATEGAGFTSLMGRFLDAGGPESPSQYKATILWGDGTSSTGTVSVQSGNTLAVSGTHTYAEEGTYTAVATLIDDGYSTPTGNSQTASTTVQVADAHLTGSGVSLTGTTGTAFNNIQLATFSDADPQGTLSDYSATINWGDGAQTSNATIQQGTGNNFLVIGSHTFTNAGHYVASIVIKDVGGSQLTISDIITITGPIADVPSNDPVDGTLLPLGEFNVELNTGAVRLAQPLDFDLSPGTSVGGNPALEYNSGTVDVRPVVQAQVPTSSSLGLPTQILATLTWDYGQSGQQVQQGVTFSTSGHNAGDDYLLGLQVHSPVTQSGLYPWQLQVLVSYANNQSETYTFSGTAGVVVADQNNALGAGWGIDGIDHLVSSSLGVLWVTGSGDSRSFFSNGQGGYVTPPGDFGTLVQNGSNGWTYTAKDQVQWDFNSSGQLTAIVDTHGLAITYSYESQGRLSGVQTPDGGMTTLVYDTGTGLLDTIEEPGGRTVQVRHDTSGNLSGLTDEAGFPRTFTYDTQHHLINDQWSPLNATVTYSATTGLVTSINLGLGSVWNITPEAAQGLGVYPAALASMAVAVVSDPLTRVTTYTLDTVGRQLELQTPDGATQYWGRDNQGDPSTVVDQLGRTTVNTYSSSGDLLQVLNPDGSTQTYYYEQTFHNVTESIDALGRTTLYSYNPTTGDLLTTTDPLGRVTTQTWSAGLLQTVTDPDKRTTTYVYDSNRRLEVTIDPDLLRTTDTYDTSGNALTVTDPQGNVTTTTYDGRNELVGQTNPDGDTTTTRYDAAGDVTQTIDPKGYTSTSYYDQEGRLTESVDNDGNTSQTLYDVAGQATETIDADSNVNKSYYNLVGLVTETVDGDNKVSQTLYDLAGQATETIDADNNVNKSYYDLMGRVTETIDGDNNASTTVYDLDGETIETIDPRGATTFTLHDADGNVTDTINGDGQGSQTFYDQAGQATETIDAGGRTSLSYYDGDGNVTETVNGDNQASYSYYNGDGNVTETVDGAGHSQQTLYDSDGRVTETIDGNGKASLTYYNQDGQVTETVDALGRTTLSYLDKDGNVTETVDGRNNPSYSYFDRDGNVTESVDADSNKTYTYYDQDGRVTETVDGNNKPSSTYYDNNGNVTETIDAAGRTNLTYYDDNGNVTETVDGNSKPSYTYYDQDGNVTETIDAAGHKKLTYYDGAGNETETIDGDNNTSYTLTDGSGNVTETIDGAGRISQSLYDQAGFLTETIDSKGQVSLFFNDGDGNVTESIDGDGNKTFTFYDKAGNVTETVDGNNKPSNSYLDADGEVTESVDADGNKTYTYYDQDGNVTETVDGNNKPSLTYYDQDGNVTETIDAGGRTNLSYYDGDGNVTETVDGNNKPSYQYLNADGQVTEAIDASSRKTLTYYDLDGNVTETVDGNNVPSTSYLDGDGNVTESIDGAGRKTLTYYDQDGNATETVDGNSQATFSYFNADGQVTETVDPDNHTSFTYYDLDGNVTETVDGNGKASYQFVDADGNVIDGIDAAGEQTQSFYNGDGQVTETIDGNGKASLTYYDNNGNVTETVDAANRTSLTYYDGDGNVTETVDGRNNPSYSYLNGDGQVTESVDADSNKTFTYYDQDGNVTGTIDPRGNASTSYLDADGNVTETVDADGNKTYSYLDGDGNVTETVDGRNNPSYSYLNGDGQVTESVDADSNKTFTYYDQDGNVTETVDGSNKPSYTYYDAAGNVTDSVDAAGRSTLSYVDGDGQVTETVDGDNKVSKTYFNNDGQVTETVDPDGHTVLSYLDGDGNVTETVDGNGKASYSYLDADGNVTESVNADGARSYSYLDGDGNVTESVDADGKTSYTYYDAAGQATETIDANNKASYFYFDQDGNATESIDANGKTSTSYFDKDGNLTESIDADGNKSDSYFDQDGNVTETIDGNNKPSFTYYDQNGNVTDSVDGDGNATKSYLDADGNVTETVDANGHASFSYFNSDGQITETIDANSVKNYTYYDQDGRVTESVDGMGDTSYSYYDAAGNLTGSVDPLGKLTQTFYDSDGNVTEVIDADNNKTQFLFDSAGNETEMIDPLGNAVYKTYDGDGRLLTETDRDGRQDVYTYDNDGRELTDTWYNANGTLQDIHTFTYDAEGRTLTAADGAGTYTYTYDNNGNMLTQQGPFGLSLTYSYDADGNQTGVVDSLGGVTTSVYDADGNLLSREFSGPGQSAVRFDQTWTATEQLGTVKRYSDLAGTQLVESASYTYDPGDRLTNLIYQNGSGTTIENETYTYDNANRLTSETENGTGTSYSYDADGELLSAGSTTYSYDPTGNRTMTGYQTGTGNEMTSDGTSSYTYDAEGNRSSQTNPTAGTTWSYGYNNADQMTSAVQTQTSTGNVLVQLNFSYDAYGHLLTQSRWTSSTGTVVTEFALSGDNTWATLNGSNGLQDRYISPDGMDALGARESGSGSVSWYVTDRQGSVMALTDNTGTVQDRLTYNAYGAVTSESNASYGDGHKYTGGWYQSDLQEINDWNRWYDTLTGRWTTEDPQGFSAGDMNPARYVGNGPTDNTDSTGQYALATNESIANDTVKYLQDKWKIESVATPLPSGRWFVAVANSENDKITAATNNAAKDDFHSINLLKSLLSPDWNLEMVGNSPRLGITWTQDTIRRFTHEGGFADELSADETQAIGQVTNTSPVTEKLDYHNIPESRINGLLRDGLAFQVKTMVYIPDVLPDGSVRVLILTQRSSDSSLYGAYATDPGIPRVPPSDPKNYTILKAYTMPGGPEPAETLKRFQTQEKANEMADLYRRGEEAETLNMAAEGVTFAYHMLPFGAAWDAAGHGDWGEMALSLAGDAAFFMGTGWAAKAAGGVRAARKLRLAAAGTELVLSGIRAGQGVFALEEGEKGKAAAYFGEATLRLLGVTPTALHYMKTVARARRIRAAAIKPTPALVEKPPSTSVAPIIKEGAQTARTGVGKIALQTEGPKCFVAGTPLLTPDGAKPIESFKPGDWVLSRTQDNIDGPIEPKQIVRNFVRVSIILEMYVAGRVIRTTEEHPFYVSGRGWSKAGLLQIGDWLCSHDGSLVPVEAVVRSRDVATVYNLEVEGHHTYFVGSKEWGFSVWAHNADGEYVVLPHNGELTLFYKTEQGKLEMIKWDPARSGGKTGPRTFANIDEADAALKVLRLEGTQGTGLVITKPGSFSPADLAASLKGITDPTAKRIRISEYLDALKAQREALGKTLNFKPALSKQGGIVFFGPSGGQAAPAILSTGEVNRNVIYLTKEGKLYLMTLEGLTPINMKGQLPIVDVNLIKGKAVEVQH